MVQKKIVAISFEEGVVFRVEDQLFKNCFIVPQRLDGL
jgi:hypothetical protein